MSGTAVLWALVLLAGCNDSAGKSESQSPGTGGAPSNALPSGTGGAGTGTGSGGARANAGTGGVGSTLMNAGSGGHAASNDRDASSGGGPSSAMDASAVDDSGSDAGTPATQGPMLPAVKSVDEAGPFETMSDLATGPKGATGVFRPSELGKDGLLHPIFVWGCGGGSNPSSYSNELTRIASHGFVVLAEVAMIGDDGAPLIAAIDWIIAENERADSVFYRKLNTAKIGLGGHSIGSVNSFIVAPDPRLTTTIHVAGGSLDDVNDPNSPTTGMGGAHLTHPAAFICAENDVFGNVEKTQQDYAKTQVPVFFTIMSGAEHVGATMVGLPAIVGWLRWQLGGELERRSMFLDPQGEFQTGLFVSQTKNW
jgi:hypothetical protein